MSRETQAGVSTGFPSCSSTLKATMAPLVTGPFVLAGFVSGFSFPQTGANTLIETDQEKAEHSQRDQYFKQGKPALTLRLDRGTHAHRPDSAKVPRRRVLRTTSRLRPQARHEISTSTSSKVIAEPGWSIAAVCCDAIGRARIRQ